MTLWGSIHPKIKNPPRETDKSKKTLFPTPPFLELRLKHERRILSVVSVGKWSGNVYRRTVVAGSEIMKMLGREANRRPQKQVASSLEIQIWSAVNCHSRGWTVIHRLCPPQRPVNRGGGGEGGEPPRTVRFPEARYWITIVNEEIRGQPASRRRSKPRWKFMECRSPLFLCPPPPPLVQTIPYFRTGGISSGQNRWGSWEAYAVFVLTIRSARSCFETSRDETTLREFTAAGSECHNKNRLGCRDLKCW